jgi:hypothetical protein
VRRDGDRFEIRGGLAALDRAGRRAAAGELTSLAALAAIDADRFGAGDVGLDHYADSFVWLRFLQAEPARAAAFRDFLAAVSRGGEPTLAALASRLPAPAEGPAIEPWLLALRHAELLRHGAPPGLPDAQGRVRVVPQATAAALPEG